MGDLTFDWIFDDIKEVLLICGVVIFWLYVKRAFSEIHIKILTYKMI